MPTVTERRVDGVLVLVCSGRLTVGGGVADFRAKMLEVVGRGERQLLLDFAGVSYIDSMGLGELSAVYANVTTAGGQLKLVNVSKPLQDLLRTVRLHSIFEIHGDIDEALRSFPHALGPGPAE